jgi:hypothetical protein
VLIVSESIVPADTVFVDKETNLPRFALIVPVEILVVEILCAVSENVIFIVSKLLLVCDGSYFAPFIELTNN